MRTRKNVKALSAAEKQNFVNAILALRHKPSLLHSGNPDFGRYDDYAEVYRNALSTKAQPGWAQGGPAFLPWHREFILQFENDLAAIQSSVTIPYWDWTDSTSNPLTDDFLGGPFALDGWNLQRDLGARAAALPTTGLQNAVLNVGIYDSAPWKGATNTFRWQCETALHQLTQRYIGGAMNTTTAPRDPLFFLHAANIDRLYAVWQGLHQASAHFLPVAGASLGHNLNDPLIFNTCGPAPFSTDATPASVLHHHTLGYRFDTEAHEAVGALKIPAACLQVLYGIIRDTPGRMITANGNIVHVPGGQIPIGPGDPWTQLSPAARDNLIGSAVAELAAQVANPSARKQLTSAAAALTGSLVRMRAASS